MGKISDLMSRARGLLDGFRPATNATDVVKHDRFEHRLFQEMREEAPAFDKVIKGLEQDVNYAEDIARDTLLQFWQNMPQMRERSEMRESHHHAHGVALDLKNSEDLKQAKRYTTHDRYGATMAAIGVSEKVHEWARHHSEALKEAQEEAEKAREEAEQAQQQLEQLEQQLADAPFLDEDFHGPLSPDQEELVEALETSVQAAQDAQQAQQQTGAQLNAAVAQAQQALAKPVNGAVSEAKEQLEEEAELMASWGVGPGELKRMSFEERARLASRLRSTRIGKYMDLVGRFKMMEAAQQVRKVEYGRDEVVGVELTGDLTRIVMAEYAWLAMGDDEIADLLELDFYRRWTEQQLLGRQFVGTEKVGKGAIVAVVDSSSSMNSADGHGITREAWSKAFAFALLDQARRQKRDFVGINFSSPGRFTTHHFPHGKGDLERLIAFVEEFHAGGTDFEGPMDEAIRIVKNEFDTNGKAKADIVFITDDECQVSTEWMRKYQAEKRRISFRTFGVFVGANRPGGTLASLSDNVRAVTEFADPSVVRDIFQVL